MREVDWITRKNVNTPFGVVERQYSLINGSLYIVTKYADRTEYITIDRGFSKLVMTYLAGDNLKVEIVDDLALQFLFDMLMKVIGRADLINTQDGIINDIANIITLNMRGC